MLMMLAAVFGNLGKVLLESVLYF